MNTEEVAQKVVELVRKQAWHEALDTLYDKDIVSVEAQASGGDSPEKRGIIPLDRFHIPKRLARTVRSNHFEVRTDTAFLEVIRACGAAADGREQSWINEEVVSLYTALHVQGDAHSIRVDPKTGRFEGAADGRRSGWAAGCE